MSAALAYKDDCVAADVFLTQPADFGCTIYNFQNPIKDNLLLCIQLGQRIPAAWVKNASARTIEAIP